MSTRKVFASGGLLKSVVVVDDGMVSRAPTSDAMVTRQDAFVLLERAAAAIVVVYTYSINNHH